MNLQAAAAIIAKTMGEGDNDKANRLFSLFVYISAIIGVIIAVFGIIFLPNIARLLGATGELLNRCVLYGRIILGIDGIWISTVVAEMFAVLNTVIFLIALKKKYKY